jgi:cyclopropane fatty-acyl-phospholipid synthase-like methyltransferase
MRWLRKVLSALEPGSAVLDLGCGSGVPAAEEIAAAHRVTGIDISQTQIRLARENVPQGAFIHADASSVRFPPDSFAAVVSFYTLEHLPREEHAALFRRIHHWLGAGGYLLISTEAAEVEGVVGEWLGAPMFFSSFAPETVTRLVQEAGFDLVETAIEKQMEGATEIPYLWLLARKPVA